jgi:hypothetical protein
VSSSTTALVAAVAYARRSEWFAITPVTGQAVAAHMTDGGREDPGVGVRAVQPSARAPRSPQAPAEVDIFLI